MIWRKYWRENSHQNKRRKEIYAWARWTKGQRNHFVSVENKSLDDAQLPKFKNFFPNSFDLEKKIFRKKKKKIPPLLSVVNNFLKIIFFCNILRWVVTYFSTWCRKTLVILLLCKKLHSSVKFCLEKVYLHIFFLVWLMKKRTADQLYLIKKFWLENDFIFQRRKAQLRKICYTRVILQL